MTRSDCPGIRMSDSHNSHPTAAMYGQIVGKWHVLKVGGKTGRSLVMSAHQ